MICIQILIKYIRNIKKNMKNIKYKKIIRAVYIYQDRYRYDRGIERYREKNSAEVDTCTIRIINSLSTFL